MRFLKNGCNVGDGKFLLEMGGKPGMGGWEIFKSLYMVGRGLLTPLFYDLPPPPYIAYPLFSNFVQDGHFKK